MSYTLDELAEAVRVSVAEIYEQRLYLLELAAIMRYNGWPDEQIREALGLDAPKGEK